MNNREILESMASMAVPALGRGYINPAYGLVKSSTDPRITDARRRKLDPSRFPTNSRNTRNDDQYTNRLLSGGSNGSNPYPGWSPWSGYQTANWANQGGVGNMTGAQLAQWLNNGGMWNQVGTPAGGPNG
jgi:hypothetical protein